MSVYIALLRGINVGGKNIVPMAGLRQMTSELGLHNPQTILQSGNLVFEGDSNDASDLEAKLEQATKDRFGVAPVYCVRSASQLLHTIQSNPFPTEAENDPSHLLVLFMKSGMRPGATDSLTAAYTGPEYYKALDSHHLFLVYPEGMGQSKLTPTLLDRHLGSQGTARNWNTVLKMARAAGLDIP